MICFNYDHATKFKALMLSLVDDLGDIIGSSFNIGFENCRLDKDEKA